MLYIYICFYIQCLHAMPELRRASTCPVMSEIITYTKGFNLFVVLNHHDGFVAR